MMEYEKFLELAKNRRSVRRYLSDPVPDDMIDRIIEAARWAPSGFNMQPWEFYVIKEDELRAEIVRMVKEYRKTHFPAMEPAREEWQGRPWKPYHNDTMDWGHAPVFIALFGDRRVIDGLPMTARMLPHKRESIFTSSLASAYMYMALAATSMGLGTQWVTAVQTPLIHSRIKEMLNAPPHFEIYDLMVLGWPALEANEKYLRPKEKMVHTAPFAEDDCRTDEEVRDFIRRSRSWARGTVARAPSPSAKDEK